MLRPYRHTLNLLLKAVVVAAVGLYLYHQLFETGNAAQLRAAFRQQWATAAAYWLWIAICLMPLNWWLEVQKWQRLLRDKLSLSSTAIWKGVMAGVTFSVFTPNRVGEYGGRLVLFPASARWWLLWTTFMGNITQLLVLLTGGFVGAYFFIQHTPYGNTPLWRTWCAVGLAVMAVAHYLFFQSPRWIRRAPRWQWLARWQQRIPQHEPLAHIHVTTLYSVWGLAVLRYTVYGFQYYCCVQFFGLGVAPPYAASAIATIFLIQTGVPLPPLLGLVARSEIALFVWGFFSLNALGTLGATFTLWIINLVLPALLGVVYILKANILTAIEEDYEKVSK